MISLRQLVDLETERLEEEERARASERDEAQREREARTVLLSVLSTARRYCRQRDELVSTAGLSGDHAVSPCCISFANANPLRL